MKRDPEQESGLAARLLFLTLYQPPHCADKLYPCKLSKNALQSHSIWEQCWIFAIIANHMQFFFSHREVTLQHIPWDNLLFKTDKSPRQAASLLYMGCAWYCSCAPLKWMGPSCNTKHSHNDKSGAVFGEKRQICFVYKSLKKLLGVIHVVQ